MSGSLKSQLKTLIAAKQYEAAILLLKASDLPDKITFINRIQKRMKEERDAENAKVEVKAPPAPPKRNGSNRNLRIAVLVGLILLLTIPVIAAIRANQGAGDELRMQFRMEDVCQKVYEDNYLAGKYTAHQIVYGCGTAVEYSISAYREEVRYCFDNQNDTLAIFMRCLADNDVKIDEVWLLTAPKG